KPSIVWMRRALSGANELPSSPIAGTGGWPPRPTANCSRVWSTDPAALAMELQNPDQERRERGFDTQHEQGAGKDPRSRRWHLHRLAPVNKYRQADNDGRQHEPGTQN